MNLAEKVKTNLAETSIQSTTTTTSCVANLKINLEENLKTSTHHADDIKASLIEENETQNEKEKETEIEMNSSESNKTTKLRSKNCLQLFLRSLILVTSIFIRLKYEMKKFYSYFHFTM